MVRAPQAEYRAADNRRDRQDAQTEHETAQAPREPGRRPLRACTRTRTGRMLQQVEPLYFSASV
jgi:hypothetical protein